MNFIEKAVEKRAAYLAAGYLCTEIVKTETSAKFSTADQYGVARELIFGEPAVSTPLLEKVKNKVPVVVAEVPVVVAQTQPKKSSKKKAKGQE